MTKNKYIFTLSDAKEKVTQGGAGGIYIDGDKYDLEPNMTVYVPRGPCITSGPILWKT